MANRLTLAAALTYTAAALAIDITQQGFVWSMGRALMAAL